MDEGPAVARWSGEVLPPRLAGKYRPLRVMASGGMGTVYEVEHEGTGERLALKVLKGGASELDPVTLERFRIEARVSARIKSEHIVRVIDADLAPELSGAPFLVMDLLEGANFAEYAGSEPQPPERVVDYLGQIARALDKAHGLGIVHRDLKPENLFLERLPDGSNRVKILDFGVAKVRADEQGNPTLSGTLLGTPLYMAPEQAEGSSERVGPGTDMWSIGLIAYRLLVGRDYWSARSVSLLLVEILTGPIVAPSACGSPLGAEFDRWFLRSCDRDPEQRWPSVAAQVEALAHALDVPHPLLPSSPRAALADTMPSASDMTQPMPLMRVVEGISGADTMRSKRRIDIRAAIGIAALAVFAVAVAAALAMRKTPSVSNSAAPITAAASRLAPAPNPTWPVPASADHGASTTVTASSAVTNPSTSSSPAAAGSPATRAVLHRPPSTARTQPKKLDPLADPK